MIIMGIDPGLAITGYGVLEYKGNHFRVIDFGVIRTRANQPLPRRLMQMADAYREQLVMHKPEAVAVEQLFFNTNAKTAIQVAQSRGVILYETVKCAHPVFEYTPLQVKMAVTGYGRSDKNQIKQMMRILLKLDKDPSPDDAADALAIAICHAHSAKINLLK